ncbi:MAG: DegV family protein [Anaerolineae bacterium]|nr:DegV family protein [Anaerolineae bacterium]
MSGIAVVTDSTANVTPEWAREHSVEVVPVYIYFGEQAYRDGVDMDAATFYRRLRSATSLPRTSQPSTGDFLATYRRLSADFDHIISIHISAELSGTVATARMAAEQLRQEMPDAAQVHVVDSRLTSGAQALLVSAASRAVSAGRQATEVVERLSDLIPRMRVVFMLATMEYLRRGGRIGAAAAVAGAMLQIKPLLQIKDGAIHVLERVRTAGRARRRFYELIESWGEGRPVRAAVAHADAPDEAQETAEFIRRRLDCRELMVVEFSPVVGAHSGPGTLGAALYADPEDLASPPG